MESKEIEVVKDIEGDGIAIRPEEIDAITDRIVSKAVVPAIQKAFRQYSGRLS